MGPLDLTHPEPHLDTASRDLRDQEALLPGAFPPLGREPRVILELDFGDEPDKCPTSALLSFLSTSC